MCMGNLKSFKVGLYCSAPPDPYYILDIKDDQYYRLFYDGSGSWQTDISIKDMRYLTKQKLFNIKIALKRALKKGYCDNLTYIEYLAKLNELSKQS